MVSLEVPLGSLAPFDPTVAVPNAAESGASGGVAVKQRGMGAATRGRRAAGVRGDVVATPRRVAVDVDAAGRAMARPRRTHQEEDGEKGSCPVEPSHVPSGLLGWLQSLLAAEPANYGDTKARVKEKGGESARLRLRGRADPLWVGRIQCPAFLCLLSLTPRLGGL